MWTPKWNDQVSDVFAGLNPSFQPLYPQRIRITKRIGCGTVSIGQFPTAENEQTLALRMDDDDFGGAD